MNRTTIVIDEPHEHLCLYCGRWSRAGGEDAACPLCHRDNPPIHNAHQLLGAWGLNVFLEEQGVGEGVVEPAWVVRLLPGAAREEIILECAWTATDQTAVRKALRNYSAAAGIDPLPQFRRRTDPLGTTAYLASETYSLDQFGHPAGLYRAVATRVAQQVAALLALGDTLAAGSRPRASRALSWAGEWLSRFLGAPPVLEPRRLGDRFCTRCFHGQPGFYEPTCSYFRDNPEVAWGSGSEPWYDLMVSVGDQLAKPDVRQIFLAGPDNAMPAVPVEGPEGAFALIGRVLAHFRPRRCPGFVPTRRMIAKLDEWGIGEISLLDVAAAVYDPLLLRGAGDNLANWLNELFEGRMKLDERRQRRPAEIAFCANRLQSLAEWMSGGALEVQRRTVFRQDAGS